MGTGAVQAQEADLVFTNANVITLKAHGDRVGAVAIKGDKIIAVGDVKEHIGAQTQVIDLHGQTLVPGFNDVHQHPAPLYSWDKPYASLELDTVTSHSESLIALLKKEGCDYAQGYVDPGARHTMK